MGRRVFIATVVSWSLLGSLAVAQEVPGRYVWPIQGYTNLSAGFCDYRTRHYHGGIDLSTNGQEGLPVRAADSGWVGRVTVGYWGYGKAVYVQMADGRMAVYGHLSELNEKIQTYVEDEQYRSKHYNQNLFPARRQIPIARGEVIGKSGQTGAGPPHLHFEIRTGDNKPLNPLAYFDKADAIRPSIYSVTIIPIQPRGVERAPSTVDGSLLPRTYPVQKGQIAATPRVMGAVGISVLADDHIDAPRWTMSAYRHRLIVNGVTLGEVRYDSINYDDTRQIEIERLYDPDGGLSPRSVNLFRRPQNTLWHYDGFADDGVLGLENALTPGRNSIRIEVEDRAGNRSAIDFGLSLDSIPARGELATKATKVDAVLTWGGTVLVVPTQSSTHPQFSLDPEGTRPIAHWIRSKGGWQAWLPAATGADVLWQRNANNSSRVPVSFGWKPIREDDGGLVTSDDGKSTVSFAAGDLYEAGAFSLKGGNAGKNSGALTPLYTLAPREIPFARDVRVQIEIPKTQVPVDKLAIYRRQGTSWSFEGNELVKEWPALKATIKRAGSFAILADRKAPVISNIFPAQGSVAKSKRPVIRFELADNLSGIGSENDLQMTLDGRWIPVEFDPDLKSAKAQPRWDLDPGRHHIEIVARDHCGNETKSERTFTTR